MAGRSGPRSRAMRCTASTTPAGSKGECSNKPPDARILEGANSLRSGQVSPLSLPRPSPVVASRILDERGAGEVGGDGCEIIMAGWTLVGLRRASLAVYLPRVPLVELGLHPRVRRSAIAPARSSIRVSQQTNAQNLGNLPVGHARGGGFQFPQVPRAQVIRTRRVPTLSAPAQERCQGFRPPQPARGGSRHRGPDPERADPTPGFNEGLTRSPSWPKLRPASHTARCHAITHRHGRQCEPSARRQQRRRPTSSGRWCPPPAKPSP